MGDELAGHELHVDNSSSTFRSCPHRRVHVGDVVDGGADDSYAIIGVSVDTEWWSCY
jgi:hypothetical protein